MGQLLQHLHRRQVLVRASNGARLPAHEARQILAARWPPRRRGAGAFRAPASPSPPLLLRHLHGGEVLVPVRARQGLRPRLLRSLRVAVRGGEGGGERGGDRVPRPRVRGRGRGAGGLPIHPPRQGVRPVGRPSVRGGDRGPGEVLLPLRRLLGAADPRGGGGGEADGGGRLPALPEEAVREVQGAVARELHVRGLPESGGRQERSQPGDAGEGQQVAEVPSLRLLHPEERRL